MKKSYKNSACLLILLFAGYLIYLSTQSKQMIPLNMNANGMLNLNAKCMINANGMLNADAKTNANVRRTQQNPPDLDRLPLVEENTTILPANEIVPLNFKDCNSQLEKEFYTQDAALFPAEHGPTNLVPLDINDSKHRRINFY